MKFQTSQKLAFLLPALLLGGCANEPTLTEQNFGESVRQMVRAQTYDPSTISSPSEATIERTDGEMLEGAIESYRSRETDTGSVNEEITINVGGGQ